VPKVWLIYDLNRKKYLSLSTRIRRYSCRKNAKIALTNIKHHHTFQYNSLMVVEVLESDVKRIYVEDLITHD
jgi:hypothetical protein